MKTLFSIGNPDKKYFYTRHNVGHLFIDFLLKKYKIVLTKQYKKFNIYETENNLIFAKSKVYMNDSASAISSFLYTTRCKLQDLIIIHDDLDIKFGEYKYCLSKSSHSHKGIVSIENFLKTKEFYRLRIGIENRITKNIPGMKYVLNNFTKEEQTDLKEIFQEIEKELISAKNF